MRLSRRDVLHEAMALLDEVGLEGLTMRRLAGRLGVRAGAIYWHFADKQALYDAMAEQMMTTVLRPRLSGRWDARLAELCRRLVAALGRHRDGARLATLALVPGEHGLAVSEALLGVLADGGLGKEATLWAASVLGYYVLGFLIDTQATEEAKARGLAAAMDAAVASVDPRRHPRVAELGLAGKLDELTSERAARVRFAFGLDVILTGLKAVARDERRRAPRGRKRPAPRARPRAR
jgi:TetR/AcrR family tetracycline transcriptional repressor